MHSDAIVLSESLRRVALRDARALEFLFDRCSPLLYGTILSIVRRKEDAEEVLGEVFFQVWQKADAFDASKGSAHGWLLSMARNRAIDRIRSRVYKGNQRDGSGGSEYEDAAQDGSASPLEMVEHAERMERVRSALRRISPEQRAVIEEAYLQGYSQSEVAGRLNMPLGTVKTRMRDGMRSLQFLLKGALCLALLAGAAFLWRRQDKAHDGLLASRAGLAALRDSLAHNAAAAEASAGKDGLPELLASPRLQVAALKGNGRARVFWDGGEQRGVLNVSDLPPAPAGREYFLWILVDDKADPCVNAGSFGVRPAGGPGEFIRFRARENMPHVKILGFEITLEPKGGMAHGGAGHESTLHEGGDDHAGEGGAHLHPVGPTVLKTETFL